MRLTQNIKLCLNVFFLISAAGLSAVLLSAFSSPSLLNEFGHSYLERYISQNRKRSDSALEQLSKGHTHQAIALLQQQFAGIQKGDRLYPNKRELFKQLVSYLYQQQNQNWMFWAETWWQLDPRDVSAMIYHQLVMIESDQGHNQGSENLQQLYEAYPEHHLWKALKLHLELIKQSKQ